MNKKNYAYEGYYKHIYYIEIDVYVSKGGCFELAGCS